MKKILTSICHVSLCGLLLLSFGCANKSATLTAHVPAEKQVEESNKTQESPVLISGQAPMRTMAHVNTTPSSIAPKKAMVAHKNNSSKKAPAKKDAQLTAKSGVKPVATQHKTVATAQKSTKGAVIIPKAKSVLGVRYRYGGASVANGFDCSGFVQWVYNHAGVKLPRTARDQSRAGVAVKSKNDMQVGDIVAFRHPRIGYHTGIYIGDNKFIHSPRRNKSIQVSDLSVSYFRRNYIGARRVAELGDAEKNAAESLLTQYSSKQRD